MSEREVMLRRCGRAYGELRLAVAFTDGIAGESAKRVTRAGWNHTKPLADGSFGEALLVNRGQARNPAIVLAASNLVGIDIDGEGGARRLKEMQPTRLPATVTVSTGKGWHLWFAPPFDFTEAAKIELAADGVTVSRDGYLVAPPGLHPSGAVYSFADGRAPWETELAVLPMPQLERFLNAARKTRNAETTPTAPSKAGARHKRLLRLGCAMRRVGACEASILAALLEENTHMCEPPQPEYLVRALARDIAQRYAPTVAP